MNDQPHVSVLLAELTAALALRPGDIAVDCTVGAGGHTRSFLEAAGTDGLVVGLDRDESALALARAQLAPALAAGRLKLVKSNFGGVGTVLSSLGISGRVQGLAADIGVSSMHLDQAERGFSFQEEGPLDMRMDRTQGRTAAEVVNEDSEAELMRIFWDYGEEPKARQIVRRIVQQRAEHPLTTTTELAELVRAAAAYRTPSRKHPATRVFQALRIFVNDELAELEAMLEQGFQALRPGGRLAVITFHSLEDRIVKNFCIGKTGRRERAELPRDLPVTEAEFQKLHQAKGLIIKPFPLVPSEDETRNNPRARSAKLRVLEKVCD